MTVKSTYDPDCTASPLRRLRARVMMSKDLEPQFRAHLNQTINTYLLSCTDFYTQQAAAHGIEAHWQAFRIEETRAKVTPGTKEYLLLTLAHCKLVAQANSCLKLAQSGSRPGTGRQKPPTRGAAQTPHYPDSGAA